MNFRLLVVTAALAACAQDTPDEKGNTALIRAAATGTVAELRELIAKGSNVRHANALGITALHFAASDPVRARILIEAGADVNAVSKQGRAPVHIAASAPGSLATLQLLAAKGADLKATDKGGNDALLLAVGCNDEPMTRFLLDQGLTPNPDNPAGNTPLQAAASHGNIAITRLLLARKARPDAASIRGGEVKHGPIQLRQLTPLMLAAAYGSPELLNLLLDAGANINAKDCRGMTPLMLSVASETQRADVVKLLLKRGADPSVKSLAGETALDWARKFNNPQVLAALGAKPAPVQPVKLANTADPRAAATRGLALLENTADSFFKNSGCLACHHSVLTAVAINSARAASLPVNEPAAAGLRKGFSLGFASFQPALLQLIDLPGGTDTASYYLMGMAASGAPADATSDALALYIGRTMRPDGSLFIGGISRSPIEEGDIHRAAVAIYVLDRFYPRALTEEKQERLARARALIERTPVRTTDDAAMKLLGLYWSKAPAVQIEAAARTLTKLQHADGGWSGNPHLSSDAYSTGLALYALHTSGVARPADPIYKRATQYLCQTQLADGSWLVRSRAPKFQPYFESGFPHGHDQWISNAATAWAVAALAPAAAAK